MKVRADKYKMPRKYDRRFRITEEDEESMKRMYAAGITQGSIARIFGISQSGVSYIVSERAREGLAAYRKTHPSKRRTKEESRDYTRELRSYKRGLIVRERYEKEEREERERRESCEGDNNCG